MKKILLLLIGVMGLAGCVADPPQPTAYPPQPTAEAVCSKSPRQSTASSSTRWLTSRWWTSKRANRLNERVGASRPSTMYPATEGVMRSDGRYTAPRLIPDQHTVQIWAKLGGHRVLSEFEVRDPARPDPDATASPGDSHLDPVYGPGSEIKMSRPIDGGLRIGESVAIAAFDRTGRPLLVYNYEIVHENRVVDYAGTITRDGVYTAPPVVPNPPPVRIRIRYFREGASPGHLSSRTGRPIKIVP